MRDNLGAREPAPGSLLQRTQVARCPVSLVVEESRKGRRGIDNKTVWGEEGMEHLETQLQVQYVNR